MGWVPQGIDWYVGCLEKPCAFTFAFMGAEGGPVYPLGVIETTVCLSGKELVPVGSFSLSPLGTAAV